VAATATATATATMTDDAFHTFLGAALEEGMMDRLEVRRPVDGGASFLVARGDGIPAGAVISRSSLSCVPVVLTSLGFPSLDAAAAVRYATTDPAWMEFAAYCSTISRPEAIGLVKSTRNDDSVDVLSAGAVGPAAFLFNNSHVVHRWSDFSPIIPGRAAPGVVTDTRKKQQQSQVSDDDVVGGGRKILVSKKAKVCPPFIKPVCPVGNRVLAASPLTLALARTDSLPVLSALAERRKTDPFAVVEPNVVVAAYMDLPSSPSSPLAPSASWELVIEVRALDKDIPAGTPLMFDAANAMSTTETAARIGKVVGASVSAWERRVQAWVASAKKSQPVVVVDGEGVSEAGAAAQEKHDNFILSLMMKSYCGPPPAFPSGPGDRPRFPAAHVFVVASMDVPVMLGHVASVSLKWATSVLATLMTSLRNAESWSAAHGPSLCLEMLLSANADERGMDPMAYAELVQTLTAVTAFAQTRPSVERMQSDASSAYLTTELLCDYRHAMGALVKRVVVSTLSVIGVQEVTVGTAGITVRMTSGGEKDAPYLFLPESLVVSEEVVTVFVDAALAMASPSA